MINLIHIGIGRRTPRRRPYGKLTVGELCKSLRVVRYRDLEAYIVKYIRRLQKQRVCRVIVAVARYRKRVFERFIVQIQQAVALCRAALESKCQRFCAAIRRLRLRIIFIIQNRSVNTFDTTQIGYIGRIIIFKRSRHRSCYARSVFTAAVIIDTFLRVERGHNSATDINIVNVLSTYSDIAVTEVIRHSILYFALIRTFELGSNHVCGKRRRRIVHLARLNDVVQHVVINYFVTQFLDFRFAEQEIIVAF